jgi:hypothetical protein
MSGPVDRGNLLELDGIESALLREATEKLNFIWRLGAAYQPPEILTWLDDPTEALVSRREFVRSHLGK